MKDKLLILGDQAVALGALHAGISGVYAYPGTPSTEITEYIQSSPLGRFRGVYCDWCTNEKTAMEAALGVSFIGKRALVCMKHVGLNVAADAFVNSAMTGTHGGLVVLVADDPSMHSSQNEQDSPFLRQIRHGPHFRTFVPAGGLRYGTRCFRSVGTREASGFDAADYPYGPFPRRSGSCRSPG